MKKEEPKERHESERHESEHPAHKGKGMHLHRMVTTQNHDGTLSHEHHYKHHVDDAHTSLIREHAATSETPEDAGAHTTDQFSMNQMGGQDDQAGAEAGAGAGAQPGAGMQPGAEEEEPAG